MFSKKSVLALGLVMFGALSVHAEEHRLTLERWQGSYPCFQNGKSVTGNISVEKGVEFGDLKAEYFELLPAGEVDIQRLNYDSREDVGLQALSPDWPTTQKKRFYVVLSESKRSIVVSSIENPTRPMIVCSGKPSKNLSAE